MKKVLDEHGSKRYVDGIYCRCRLSRCRKILGLFNDKCQVLCGSHSYLSPTGSKAYVSKTKHNILFPQFECYSEIH